MDITDVIARTMAFILAWLVLGTIAFVAAATISVSAWFGVALPPVIALWIAAVYLNIEAWRST